MKYIYSVFITLFLLFYSNTFVFAEDCSQLDQLIIKAKAGDANSQNKLGDYYNFATCVELNHAKAFYWYEKSASAGNSDAQNSMGLRYALGSGIKLDMNKAIYWWEKSAQNGNFSAMKNLGNLYEEGDLVSKDLSKANYWYNKAAPKIKIQAQGGNINAMNSMGDIYSEGQGVQQDYSQAFYWWHKAANIGSPIAMNSLGYAYLSGDGVDMDYPKAIYWFQKSADAGDPIAMYYLGQANEVGASIKQDYSKAFYWYQKSAEKGGRNAVYELAKLSEAGVGTERNIVKALSYYQEACSFNITAACLIHDVVGKTIKQDQLLNAKSKSGIKWYTYHNAISEYQIRLPDFLILQGQDSANQQVFLAKDGGKLLVTKLENNKDSKKAVIDFLKQNGTDNNINITYNFHRDNWGVFSGTSGQSIFYNKFIVDDKNNILIFELIYPNSQQITYGKLIKNISTSFIATPINIKDDE